MCRAADVENQRQVYLHGFDRASGGCCLLTVSPAGQELGNRFINYSAAVAQW